MTKDIIKKRSIVVMDKGYKGVMDSIYHTVFYIAGDVNEDIIAHPLSPDYMDKVVIKFRATDYQMEVIQERIEDFYPGLCIFNPPMYV